MPNIDELSVQINANARGAYNAIKKLSDQLTSLSVAVNNVDISRMTAMGDGIVYLGNSMQSFRSLATNKDFSSLRNNLNKLSSVDALSTHSLAISLNELADSIKKIQGSSEATKSLAELATALSKLGSKSIENAKQNLPELGNALNNLLEQLSQAPQVSQNIIEMTNALANLYSQSANISKVGAKVSTSMSRTDRAMSKTERKSKSLAQTFGKLYASYFIIIRAVKAFKGAIESTSDYIEAFNYYSVTLDKIGRETAVKMGEYGDEAAEEFTDKFTKALNSTLNKMSGLNLDETSGLIVDSGLKNLGMSLTQLSQYAASIAAITNAVGMEGEASIAAAKATTMLAADLGSLKNLDFDTVSANIQSALTGQARALYKYGIDVTDTMLEVIAAENGVNKAVSEMTQSEKMQLRLLAILKHSKIAWGDLANTINSPGNMLRQFNNNLQETSTVLGQLFIPMLEKAMPVINGFTIALKSMFVSLAELLGIELHLGDFGEGYTNALEEVAESEEAVADAADKAKKGIRAFDELNVISSSKGDKDALSGTLDLTEAIVKATGEYEKVWNEAYEKMQNSAQTFADNIEKRFKGILEVAEPTIEALKNFNDDVLKPIGEFTWDNLSNLYNELLKPLGEWTLSENGIPKLFDAFRNGFDGAELGEFSENLKDFYTNIKPFAQGVGQGLIDFLEGVAKMVGKGAKTLINGISKGLEALNNILERFDDDALEKSGETLGKFIGVLITLKTASITASWITKMGTSIGGMFSSISVSSFGLSVAAVSAVMLLIDNLVDVDTSKVSTNASAVKTAMDGLKGALDSAKDLQDADADFSEIVDKYFELANKDSLTSDESRLVKAYAQDIIDYLGPNSEVAKVIDEHTGLYTGTEQEIRKIIEAESDYIKLKAGEEILIETQKKIFETEKKLSKLMDESKTLGTNLHNTWQNMVGDLPDWAKWFALDVPADMLYNLVTISERGAKEAADIEIADTLKELADAKEYLEDFESWLYGTETETSTNPMKGYIDGISASKEEIQKAITETISPTAGTDAKAQAFMEVFGGNSAGWYSKGFTDAKSATMDSISSAITPDEELKQEICDKYSSMGSSASESYTNALNKKLSDIELGYLEGLELYTPTVASPSGQVNANQTSSSSGTGITEQINRANNTNNNLTVEVKVEADPAGIFKTVRSEVQNFTRRTGQPAFGG